jgi:hypothetical protein
MDQLFKDKKIINPFIIKMTMKLMILSYFEESQSFL